MKIKYTSILLVFLLVLVSQIQSEEFNISNPAEFQSALTIAASNGEADVINVAAGTYNICATLNFYSEEDYPIHIAGTSEASTILDGADANKLLQMETVYPNADIRISQLRFSNGYDVHGVVSLNLESANADIINCEFLSNTATEFGDGMTIYCNDGQVLVDDCQFEDNVAIGNDAGNPDFPHDPDGSVADIGAYYFGAGLGVDELNAFHSVKLYPNPVLNVLNIEVETSDAYALEIYDLSGHKVLQKKGSSKSIQIDISQLQAGMYMLRINSGNKSVLSQKFNKENP
jgi:hypothetical protein